MGPSAIAVPVKGQEMAIPDPMNKDEIELVGRTTVRYCSR